MLCRLLFGAAAASACGSWLRSCGAAMMDYVGIADEGTRAALPPQDFDRTYSQMCLRTRRRVAASAFFEYRPTIHFYHNYLVAFSRTAFGCERGMADRSRLDERYGPCSQQGPAFPASFQIKFVSVIQFPKLGSFWGLRCRLASLACKRIERNQQDNLQYV